MNREETAAPGEREAPASLAQFSRRYWGETQMIDPQKILELSAHLLDAAHYCTELSRLEFECQEIARKLEALAEEAQTSSIGEK